MPLAYVFACWKYVNEAETSLELFKAVSVFCFIFLSKSADVWNKTEIKQNFISALFQNILRDLPLMAGNE